MKLISSSGGRANIIGGNSPSGLESKVFRTAVDELHGVERVICRGPLVIIEAENRPGGTGP
jgi:hypothetical protein